MDPSTAHFVHGPGSHVGTMFNAESTNWSGEIADSGPYSEVAGQWTVPAVQATAAAQYSATWIGVDGAEQGSTTLLQTGTAQSTGPVRYFAWYEIVPAPPLLIPYPVAHGDGIAAWISETSPGTWQITMDDTGHWSFSQTVNYNGPADTAEWIEEAPTVNDAQSTLADFGTVDFSDVTANGVFPAVSTMIPVSMVNEDGAVLDNPSAYQQSTGTFSISYVGPVPPPLGPSGYDLVGRDGGVFVFGNTAGFYGSLPGLGVHVLNIVGMVPTADDHGYFLVGSDGGVFAFGDAPFLGSLPGLGVHINNVVGIVPTPDDHGYFLVGSDGGVFAFGDAPFLGSLPGEGIRVSDIIGIAADATGQGYWLIAATGQVYAFGDAQNMGSAIGSTSPVSAIESTPDGDGYWITTQNGSVYTFGDAGFYGSLPGLGVNPARPVIGLVTSADDGGYWLIGADGGIFAFGDAPFVGSLPGLHVSVSDIVGAVPTTG